ncbi:hypothetical protein NVP1084O_201 [Vibrio phage 1.084.O._10N.261.49.F5]|nr:hypothetical protein NVP1084O_201 [Vibrio phage 1.084.O._10N.261.49.F5]
MIGVRKVFFEFQQGTLFVEAIVVERLDDVGETVVDIEDVSVYDSETDTYVENTYSYVSDDKIRREFELWCDSNTCEGEYGEDDVWDDTQCEEECEF